MHYSIMAWAKFWANFYKLVWSLWSKEPGEGRPEGMFGLRSKHKKLFEA
jgi:hypothetical protein